MRYLFA
jgi:hypothetical protein